MSTHATKFATSLVFIKQRENAQTKRFGKYDDPDFQTGSRYLYYIQSSLVLTTYIA